MRVLLAYPPDFNPPTMPFGALALLNACLKQYGHETRCLDINAEAFVAMLAPQNLGRYFELLDIGVESLRKMPARTPDQDRQLEILERLYAYPRHLMLKSNDCYREIRERENFFDPEKYVHMDRVLRMTHSLLHSLTPSLDPRNSNYRRQLYEFLVTETIDPYSEYYQSGLIPRLIATKPELIALTCPFSTQISTGMYFAKLLKRAMPGVKFVMGGTGISDAVDVVLTDPRYYEFIDYAIVGDGEESLPDLVHAMEGKKSLDDVAGLWRRENGEVVQPKRYHNVDMNLTPTPDYRDIDFSPYAIPEPASIYTTSRGCYYGKCTFCPESFRQGFRKRSPQRVYEDVRDIVLNQGVRNIHFFDPLTPPVTLEYVARQVAKENLPVNWYAEVKFETIYTNKEYVRKLAQGGCRQLQFGFESGVQRVLDGMIKGNKLDQIEIILENLKENDITVAVTWFVGFPTENEPDARESWSFVRRHAETIFLSLYTGRFGLGHDVPVFQKPEDYNVDIVYDADGNIGYKRRDGGDWNQIPLHETFHVRSDIPIAINAAGLLFATYNREGLLKIRGMSTVGPAAHEGPPLADRTASVPAENNWIELAPDDAGKRRGVCFVAQSCERFDIDAADIVLLERLKSGPVRLGDLLRAAPEDERAALERRLALFVNRGYVRTADPLLPGFLADRKRQAIRV